MANVNIENAFTKEARVTIYYMLAEEFPAAEYGGTFGGIIGGEEQELLEKNLRKEFQVLRLAPGSSVAGKLKAFIIGGGRARHLITMLEMMPAVRRTYVETANLSQKEKDDQVESLKARILDTLAKIGLTMTFSSDGKLVETAADQVPKALADLPNRDRLKQNLATCLQKGEPTAIVFIDLDNFKVVNDKKNHAAGDKCLERVAALTGEVVALKGRTYRYGGDEFVVLLSNFTTAEAAAVGERIRRALDEGAPDPDIKVTGSIGVASTDVIAKDVDGLLLASDDAASASKLTGQTKKNKVTSAPLSDATAEELKRAREAAKGR